MLFDLLICLIFMDDSQYVVTRGDEIPKTIF